MAKFLREMTHEDMSKYMTLLAKATHAITPSDARFIILMTAEGMEPQYISSIPKEEIKTAIAQLRSAADRLEFKEKINIPEEFDRPSK